MRMLAPRAPFYIDLRYEADDGTTPDLELVDRTTSVGELNYAVRGHEGDAVDMTAKARIRRRSSRRRP